MPFHRLFVLPALLAATLGLPGCAGLLPTIATSAPAPAETAASRPARPPATLWALTEDHQLLRLRADAPQQVLARRPVQGLAAGDSLLGIDYRVSRGVMFALSAQGRLYTVDTASGQLSPVGPGIAAPGPRLHGFDFNPVADRIRVVATDGRNLRLHPDTGAAVDGDASQPGLQDDPRLHYAPGDVSHGWVPQVAAAAYSYNPRDDKLTTNYAIDIGLGLLVRQGSLEGVQPVVSPNTGRLFTVGPLGLPGAIDDAAFDIADVDNQAWAALRSRGATRLYRIDLATGRAVSTGLLADGAPVRGLAIEP